MDGAKWMSVGNDRIVEMFSLHSIYSYVLSSWFTRECSSEQRVLRANQVSDLPALEISPTLVLVLICLTVAPSVYPPTIALLLLKT